MPPLPVEPPACVWPPVAPLPDEPPFTVPLFDDEPVPVVPAFCVWFVGGVGLLDTALSRLEPPLPLPQAASSSISVAAPARVAVRRSGKPAGWADGLERDTWPRDGRTIMMSAPANEKIPEEDPAAGILCGCTDVPEWVSCHGKPAVHRSLNAVCL